MAEDLAMLVDAARTRAFVGRVAELTSFESALGAEVPTRVLFVHGPGGVGKTALLHQFGIRAREAGNPVVRVDGQDVDCTPEGLTMALSAARASSPDSTAGAGWVLLIDGYERLAAVDDWIRETLVASLPANVRVVIAGRESPTSAWRTDPGWRAVVEPLPIGVLDPDESEELLANAGVPEGRREHLLRIGRGHPLTLALLADAAVSGDLPDDLASAPDLVSALVARLVEEAPDDDHALAVALCAYAWLTTQDMVDELLGRSAPEVWAWLETRPWVTRGTYGLYPHDLVRDVLDSDLKRRSPATYRRVNRRLHEHTWTALRGTDAMERRLWAHQKLFLHRRSPLASSFWALRTQGAGAVVPGRSEDHPAVLQMVARFEGQESAQLAERWLAAQPENLSVVRSPSGLDGFALHVLCPADPSLVEDDPVVRAAVEMVTRTSPARPGEQISIGRFFAGRSEHQRDAYAVVAGSVSSTLLWTTRPLAWSFVATTDPEFWGPAFQYIALTTRLQAEFAGSRYTLYGVDWRRLPPERWFDLLGERELTGEAGPPPARLLRPSPMPRERFADMLRVALRDLNQPDRLRANELMGSRLALDFDTASVGWLRDTVVAGIEHIGREPRGGPLQRVLDRTYVHCAPTQEAAAAVLDLPFSTYRRHLARAVERLTDLLWAVEIGDVRLEGGQEMATKWSGG